jgi:hypothetical protein
MNSDNDRPGEDEVDRGGMYPLDKETYVRKEDEDVKGGH